MEYIGAQLLAEQTIDLLVWWPVLLCFGQAGLMALVGFFLIATGIGSRRGLALFYNACILVQSLLVAPFVVLIAALLWTSARVWAALIIIAPVFLVGNGTFIYVSLKSTKEWRDNDLNWYVGTIVTWTYLDNFILKQFITNDLLFQGVTVALYALRWFIVHSKVGVYCLSDFKQAVKAESDEKDRVKTSLV